MCGIVGYVGDEECATLLVDGLRVAVPLVVSRDTTTGVETIRWVSVLEEITPGAFNVASTLPQTGMVGVRLNYPFQAAALSAYQEVPFPNTPEQAHDAHSVGRVVESHAMDVR